MTLSEQLKKKGYHYTPIRKQVIAWIEKKKGIFSAKEILLDVPLDKVSVYRTLDLLKRLDIIHSVSLLHGEEHFELHGEDHHHHIVCQGCEKTACVDCIVPQKKIPGFLNIHHSYILTGTCSVCVAK